MRYLWVVEMFNELTGKWEACERAYLSRDKARHLGRAVALHFPYSKDRIVKYVPLWQG